MRNPKGQPVRISSNREVLWPDICGENPAPPHGPVPAMVYTPFEH